MTSKIAIIGSGNVGGALAKGLKKVGYDVRVSDETNVAQTASGVDYIFLAVPYLAIDDVLKKLGSNIDGKILVDVTNALTPEMQLAIGFSSSGAEELQKKAPKAKVVKAFNTVFAQHMDSGKVNGEQLTAFVASDNEEARNQILKIATAIGFNAVNAGGLQNARLLESLGYFNIQLGYMLGNGVASGFKYYAQK